MRAQTNHGPKPGPQGGTAADASLERELVFAAAAIARRRADLIHWDLSGRLIERGWLEWHGGALRMTRDGAAACDAALRHHH